MEIKRLDEVCDFQNGFAFKSSSFKTEGLPILRISNIQNNSISTKDLVFFDEKDYRQDFERYKVFKDDILIAMSGGTTGKLGVNTTDKVYYLNQRVGKFSPKKNLNRQYLYYFLHTKTEESLKIAGGAAQPNLSTEQIKNFQIPIPPLSEQQAIVEKLDTAFELIDRAKTNIEQNIQNAKEMFQSKLNEIFSQKGDGWEEKFVTQVCSLKSGATLNVNLERENGEVPYLKVADMNFEQNKKGNIVTSSRFVNLVDINKNQIIPTESIIFPKRGGAILTDKKRFTLVDVVVDLNTMAAIPIKETIDPKFLWYFFLSFKLSDIANGTTILQINNHSFKDVKFSFTKSLETQQKIVALLDELSAKTDQLQQKYRQKLANMEELRKSILEKAFKGELV